MLIQLFPSLTEKNNDKHRKILKKTSTRYLSFSKIYFWNTQTPEYFKNIQSWSQPHTSKHNVRVYSNGLVLRWFVFIPNNNKPYQFLNENKKMVSKKVWQLKTGQKSLVFKWKKMKRASKKFPDITITIWQPDSFWLFEYQNSLVFRSPLYCYAQSQYACGLGRNWSWHQIVKTEIVQYLSA